jgi:glycosyltransferase involved in cell wall biosynthesis
MIPIKLLTFSSLYPSTALPNHGVFVENRLRHLVANFPVRSVVVAPVPFFPSGAEMFGTWGRYARVPAYEVRGGLEVHHPRFAAIPRVGMTLAPRLLYQASRRTIAALIRDGLTFDAIDAHYVYPDGVAAVWLGRYFKRPVVLTARGSDVTLLPAFRGPRRMIARALGEADGLIAVSAALARLMETLGAPAGSVTVLRNGVDAAAFRPMDRAAARAELGLTRPTLISVGQLISRKGHHRAIEALVDLPEWDLLIVGEGPEKANLAALIARLGLGARARLLGAQPHTALPRYYSAADALILASDREGWANVLLEAMACGTAAIASNIPGSSEVVQRPEAGRVMTENTPAGIVAAVRDLFAVPPSRAATRAYAEAFGWEQTSAGQYALFSRLVRGDRADAHAAAA